jgi:lysophospholipase L1-like esterase
MTTSRHWLLSTILLAGILGGSLHSVAIAAPLKIMPLGDSITYGYPFPDTGGYRLTLQNSLAGAGYSFDFVGRSTANSGTVANPMADPQHEGYSGATINYIASIADAAMTAGNPDVVLLFAGTNDIRDNGDNSNPANPNYWPTAPARLDALITQLNTDKPGVKIIVGNMMNFFGTWDYVNSRAASFNTELSTIIANHQNPALHQNVTMVNLHDALTLSTDYWDGLHPSTDGYAKMASVWFAGIQHAVSTPEPGTFVMTTLGFLSLLAFASWKRRIWRRR